MCANTVHFAIILVDPKFMVVCSKLFLLLYLPSFSNNMTILLRNLPLKNCVGHLPFGEFR